MKSNIQISIGISAYNEGKNIYWLLNDLLNQRLKDGKRLVEIIVISDGSSDNTVNIVKSFKDKRIVLIDGKTRKGKNQRINEICAVFKGDLLVLIDADIKLNDNLVINTVTGVFRTKKNIGLVAGNVQPLPAKTIYDAASNNFIESLNFIKGRINNGDNIFSVRGPLLALSQAFAKKINIPTGVPDDRFIYFESIKYGFKFLYEDQAKVWFKSPQTLSEQIMQWSRFKSDKENLSKAIDEEVIAREYFKPFYLKLAAMLFQIIKNPIAYLTMKYIHLRVVLIKTNRNPDMWQIIKSTKILA